MSAFSKNNQEKPAQILGESPTEIRRRRQAISAQVDNRVGESPSQLPAEEEQTGLAAEKAVGALCFLPKSIHRLASRAAEDRDITSKRYFMELILIGLEQQGVITKEQHAEALTLPFEFGWKGRKSNDGAASNNSL